MGEGREISCGGHQETWRNGLLRDAGAGRVGRAGTGYDFVCADAGRSGARVYGDVYGAGRDEFRSASAAPAVWHGDAEEKIFAAHGDRRDARRILLDGGCGRSGRGGDTGDGASSESKGTSRGRSFSMS